MSASEPTAIVPFFGYIPNIFAGAVAMISTQRSREIRPPTTPPSWRRSTRSSTAGRPFDVHVVGRGADRPAPVRVVDQDVGVRADGDRALLRVHPEHLRGCRGHDLHPCLLYTSD